MEPLSTSLIIIGCVLGCAVVVGIFYVLYRCAKYGARLGIWFKNH